MRRRIAIVGAGWSGLSAAVRAVRAGCEVHLFEMAHQAGGRARSAHTRAGHLDNGQHIMIGAYRDALDLMQVIGVDIERSLMRTGLDLRFPDGAGLALPIGSAVWGAARSVGRVQSWKWRERAALLLSALRWSAGGFRCPPEWTVERLARHLPSAVVGDLIEPLCVAALNTPMGAASAQIFLRVVRDSLFGGAGSADLMLPRVPLSALMGDPAVSWLAEHGATVHWGHRVMELTRSTPGWRIDGEVFEDVVLATTAREAARLVAPIDPRWSRCASGVTYQPILTVWLRDAGLRWPRPMIALRCSPQAPAQFAFDIGTLGGPAGHFAFVVSGAGEWVERGLAATAEAVVEQGRKAFPGAFQPCSDPIRHVHAEHRATFSSVSGLRRPRSRIADRLHAAGDFVDGPYPSTLEGAVQSGRQAVDALALEQQKVAARTER